MKKLVSLILGITLTTSLFSQKLDFKTSKKLDKIGKEIIKTGYKTGFINKDGKPTSFTKKYKINKENINLYVRDNNYNKKFDNGDVIYFKDYADIINNEKQIYPGFEKNGNYFKILEFISENSKLAKELTKALNKKIPQKEYSVFLKWIKTQYSKEIAKK